MEKHIDLHGYEGCPFAWRTRLSAAEKGVPFDWVPCDVANPDPRSATQNTGQHSPLLVHDWLTLTESAVICQYINEAFPGRALEPEDPAKRALARLAMIELDFDFGASKSATPETRRQANEAFKALDTRLRQGPWLGGDAPSLLDIKIIPMVASTILRQDIGIAAEYPLARQYWERTRKLDSYQQTRPPWAN